MPRPIRRGATPAQPQLQMRSIFVLSLLTALGVAALEHIFYRFQLGEVNWIATGLAAHTLLDIVLLIPLAFLALALAFRLAPGLRMDGRGWAGLLGTTALACLLFSLGVMPASVPRDNLHESLGVRYGLAMAELPGTSLQTPELTLKQAPTALCSYRGAGRGTLLQQDWPWRTWLCSASGARPSPCLLFCLFSFWA